MINIASCFQIINRALNLQESSNIKEASERNPMTDLGNELLDNLNCLIGEINLTAMGMESRQSNNIKDKILLQQDHVHQVILVFAQLQISLDLTNEHQKTLDQLKDLFIGYKVQCRVRSTITFILISDFLMFYQLQSSFHHKWNVVQLLPINMVYMSCHTSWDWISGN